MSDSAYLASPRGPWVSELMPRQRVIYLAVLSHLHERFGVVVAGL